MPNVKKYLLGVSTAGAPLAHLSWSAQKTGTPEALELFARIAPYLHVFYATTFIVLDELVSRRVAPRAGRRQQLAAVGALAGLVFGLVERYVFDVPRVIYGLADEDQGAALLPTVALHSALFAVVVFELERELLL